MSSRRRRGRMPLNGEINVVSLIDVMMLLMVIFMITAPIMQGGVDVNLPEADARPLESKSGMIVTIRADHRVYIDDDPRGMRLSEFSAAFAAILEKRHDR